MYFSRLIKSCSERMQVSQQFHQTCRPFSNYKVYMEKQFGFDFTDMDEVTDVPEF